MARVLLIEDDPDIRALVQMTLRLDGIEVTPCADGRTGLRALEAGGYDLVILDIMLPDLSGFEILERIQTGWGSSAPPVALFTARPVEDVARELGRCGKIHILPKPFEPAGLAQSVHAMIRT